MNKIRCFAIIVLAGVAIVLAGCTKNNDVVQVGQPTDQDVLQNAVINVDSIAQFSTSDEATIDDDGMNNPEFDGISGMMYDHLSFNKVSLDSIYPVRWGRHIFWRQITRTYQTVIQGDSALVTIVKTIPGEFRIGLGTKAPDTTIVDTVIRKPFTETVTRLIRFKRIAHTNDPFKNWLPVKITMVQGKTSGVNNFQIASLEVADARQQYDTTFTDPLNSWFRLGLFHGSIPIFHAGDSVLIKATLTSSDSSAEIVHLRHGIAGNRLERRRSLMKLDTAYGGPGNYTRVFMKTFHAGLPPVMGMLAGRFNIIVDVISRGSIYVNSAPFSNEFWGMPYIVVR